MNKAILLSSAFLLVAYNSSADFPKTTATQEITTMESSHDKTLTTLSENPADMKISQDIRQALMADSSLSVNAKNVKIMTKDKVVQLRGAVDNEAEKAKIGKFAKEIPGVASVENFLEVQAPK